MRLLEFGIMYWSYGCIIQHTVYFGCMRWHTEMYAKPNACIIVVCLFGCQLLAADQQYGKLRMLLYIYCYGL